MLSACVQQGNCSRVPGGCHSSTLPCSAGGERHQRMPLLLLSALGTSTDTCLQLEVSLRSGEASPERAFASSGVSQSLPGSHNLLLLC